MRGWCASASTRSSCGEAGQHLARPPERVLLRGQGLHEAAAGLEEIGQLVHAQLPR